MSPFCKKVLTMWFKMHPWVFPTIIGCLGILYLICNIGAIIETKKIKAKGSDHHISGIRFLEEYI